MHLLVRFIVSGRGVEFFALSKCVGHKLVKIIRFERVVADHLTKQIRIHATLYLVSQSRSFSKESDKSALISPYNFTIQS